MFKNLCRLSLVLSAGYGATSYADPFDDFEYNRCNLKTGARWDNSLTATYIIPIRDYYVPRDLPIGGLIGTTGADGIRFGANNLEGYEMICNREKNAPPDPKPEFVSELQATSRLYEGTLPSFNGQDLTGKVFYTSAPGVGVALMMYGPYYSERNPSDFTPEGGSRIAPFRAFNRNYSSNEATNVGPLQVTPILIKIGKIPPGRHTIDDRQLLQASMMPDLRKAFTVAVTGSVTSASCTLSPTQPVSDTPVKLGEWSTDHFTGPESVTTPVPFHINLLDCGDNPTPGSGAWQDEMGFATAHIRLEGVAGSTVVDKDLGLFTLDSSSSARGVGIQMLRADGVTPVTLGEETPVKRIASSGATQLDFTARFHQLPGSSHVTAGSANGALNFTISYQ
jgi:type 1 fimbria pilin